MNIKGVRPYGSPATPSLLGGRRHERTWDTSWCLASFVCQVRHGARVLKHHVVHGEHHGVGIHISVTRFYPACGTLVGSRVRMKPASSWGCLRTRRLSAKVGINWGHRPPDYWLPTNLGCALLKGSWEFWIRGRMGPTIPPQDHKATAGVLRSGSSNRIALAPWRNFAYFPAATLWWFWSSILGSFESASVCACTVLDAGRPL